LTKFLEVPVTNAHAEKTCLKAICDLLMSLYVPFGSDGMQSFHAVVADEWKLHRS